MCLPHDIYVDIIVKTALSKLNSNFYTKFSMLKNSTHACFLTKWLAMVFSTLHHDIKENN